MPYILKAFSLALHDFPIVNAWYNKDQPFEYAQIDNHNLSFAIASPKGLIVPNIKNCQNKSVYDIHTDFSRIIDDANNGTLSTKDLFDGTFTVSNIGKAIF
jgi:2-oxoisovalerate dehydrogenase E2 component (dihydrolipoyl transacylase)